jgi:predicted transcriptional regulator
MNDKTAAMTTPNPTKLTRRERAIMDILHRRMRATAHEVLEDLDDPPSYLGSARHSPASEERGYAQARSGGRDVRLLPAVSDAVAKRSALAHVVRTFFAGSVEQAVAALVDPS